MRVCFRVKGFSLKRPTLKGRHPLPRPKERKALQARDKLTGMSARQAHRDERALRQVTLVFNGKGSRDPAQRCRVRARGVYAVFPVARFRDHILFLRRCGDAPV